MSSGPSYSDAELASAVGTSTSWRGVLRTVGLRATSAGSARAARRRADELSLDYSHFTGARRWTDADLSRAVESCDTWSQVLERLGLAASGSSRAAVEAHAVRLGLPVDRLRRPAKPARTAPFATRPAARNLGRTGPMLAAAWFTMCGHDVSWPLEPCRYDLLVCAAGRTWRIQVKTTTRRSGGSWVVQLSTSRRRGALVYGPDEVDHFFLIDGDLSCYLVPYDVVGGFQAIQLPGYEQFRVTGPLGATFWPATTGDPAPLGASP